MDTEAHIIIAFLYKRSGKKQLTLQELLIPLSFELHWFPHTEAQQFIQYAQSQKLLKKNKDKTYSPTFKINDISIPTGFRPTTTAFKKPQSTPKKQTQPLLETLITKISTVQHKTPAAIQKEIQHITEEKKITPEVAAAYLARKEHIDLSNYYDQIRTTLTQENEQ